MEDVGDVGNPMALLADAAISVAPSSSQEDRATPTLPTEVYSRILAFAARDDYRTDRAQLQFAEPAFGPTVSRTMLAWALCSHLFRLLAAPRLFKDAVVDAGQGWQTAVRKAQGVLNDKRMSRHVRALYFRGDGCQGLDGLFLDLLCKLGGQLIKLSIAEVPFGEPERAAIQLLPTLRQVELKLGHGEEMREDEQIEAAAEQLTLAFGTPSKSKAMPIDGISLCCPNSSCSFLSLYALQSLETCTWQFLGDWKYVMRNDHRFKGEARHLTLRDCDVEATHRLMSQVRLNHVLARYPYLDELVCLSNWGRWLGTRYLSPTQGHPQNIVHGLHGLLLTRLHLENVTLPDEDGNLWASYWEFMGQLAEALPELRMLDMRFLYDDGRALAVGSCCGSKMERRLQKPFGQWNRLEHFGTNFLVTNETIYDGKDRIWHTYYDSLFEFRQTSDWVMQEDVSDKDTCRCNVCVRSVHELGQQMLVNLLSVIFTACPTLRSAAVMVAQESLSSKSGRKRAAVQVAQVPKDGDDRKALIHIPGWHEWPLSRELVDRLNN